MGTRLTQKKTHTHTSLPVRLKTVSDDNAFSIVGTLSFSENRTTFGLDASIVAHSSNFSSVKRGVCHLPNCSHMHAHNAQACREGKGRERKGMEGEGREEYVWDVGRFKRWRKHIGP